jgi:hypothetical protein
LRLTGGDESKGWESETGRIGIPATKCLFLSLTLTLTLSLFLSVSLSLQVCGGMKAKGERAVKWKGGRTTNHADLQERKGKREKEKLERRKGEGTGRSLRISV